MKNDLLCTPQGRILWLSKTCQGHVHDKKIMDEQPLALPQGITLWQDTGFVGHNPENVTVKMPAKKPKGKELSHAQKQENRKNIEFPYPCGTCHRRSQKMSYCQRPFQVSQVWV